MCDEIFTCQQNIKEQKTPNNGLNAFFKGYIFPKMFLKKKAMKSHFRIIHKIPLFECKECEKQSRLQQANNQHMEKHITCEKYLSCKILVKS